jgi:hypothetical protein
MKNESIKIIFDELTPIYQDLKAEILIAEIQEKTDLLEDDFLIKNRSTFSRSYRRDIISVKNNVDKDWLTLNLSRNGLYDHLPEGLFHSRKSSKATSYAAYRTKQKKQEKDARLFFAPIENEFFQQKLNIEKNERKLLYNFSNLKDDFLLDFWNIDCEMPKEFALKLIKILPFSHKIAGDYELTRLSLEKILGVNVKFTRKLRNTLKVKRNRKKQKEHQLGIDMVLNSPDKEIFYPYIEAEIGPIHETKIARYLTKDGILKFIEKFYDYFVPLEMEVDTKFVVVKEDGFVLSNSESPIIGISTKI